MELDHSTNYLLVLNLCASDGNIFDLLLGGCYGNTIADDESSWWLKAGIFSCICSRSGILSFSFNSLEIDNAF